MLQRFRLVVKEVTDEVEVQDEVEAQDKVEVQDEVEIIDVLVREPQKEHKKVEDVEVVLAIKNQRLEKIPNLRENLKVKKDVVVKLVVKNVKMV